MDSPTYLEIARDWDLWEEQTVEQRLAHMVRCFGPDPTPYPE
jgi:hypothetical protein